MSPTGSVQVKLNSPTQRTKPRGLYNHKTSPNITIDEMSPQLVSAENFD